MKKRFMVHGLQIFPLAPCPSNEPIKGGTVFGRNAEKYSYFPSEGKLSLSAWSRSIGLKSVLVVGVGTLVDLFLVCPCILSPPIYIYI